jgi:long-chain acyl-CoA synthetase
MADNSKTMTRHTILRFLADCEARGGATALANRRGVRVVRWSYARLAASSYQTARELEARGVVQGDRVIVWAENSAEWVAAFFGCLLRGAIVVPLDAASAPDFTARVESQVGAKFLFVGDVDAGDLSRRVPSLQLSNLSSTISHHPANRYDAAQIAEDDIAEIIYTSGTTAEPKGVVLTHRNLLANLAPIEREMKKYLKWERLVHPIRFLNLVPLSHVFGQFMGIFVPQLIGGEVFFQDALKPSEIIETTKRERISVIVAVPRLLDTLREKIERDYEMRGRRAEFQRALDGAKRWNTARRWWAFREVHRIFGWKFWAFVVGGATLDDETETFWRRLGYAVVQGYGMTETASLVSVNHPFKQGRGSIGEALPGQEIKLGDGGEIMVRGANVSPGYWDAGALRAANDSDGWLRTGDVAEIDAHGKLYFKGRIKDVIVTAAGLNIHPEDLEAALNHQTEVRASAVVGIEDARGGDEPVAVLVLRDAGANVEAIIRRANESLARHQQIRRWLIWNDPDLPRTPTQKIKRREVAKIVRARLIAASNGSSVAPIDEERAPHDALTDVIARICGEAASSSRLSAAMNLMTDLKLDSLGRVELLGALEDRFQIELDEATFTAATTLGDVQRIIRRSASGVADEEGAHGDDESRSTARDVETLRDDAGASVARYPYPRWARRFPATWIRLALLYSVILPFVRRLCPLRVKGRENLVRLANSPVLFVANHVTYIDHALILDALPARRARRLAIAMEGERLRDWRHAPHSASLFARLIGLAQYFIVTIFFNVFPLPRKSGFRRSFAYAGESADQGFNLLVFPEGKRTEDGRMGEFMAGTGLLVKELGVTVVPVRIEGLYELKLRSRRRARRGEVSVTFGEPAEFSDEEPLVIAKELRRRVAELGRSV